MKIESVRGKTISEIEVIDISAAVEVEIRFTDDTCLHVAARGRAEVEIREFDSDCEPTLNHGVVVQD